MESLDGIYLRENSILNKAYKITKVISISEIAIMYLGIYIQTGKVVAIKEFFPKNLALRDIDNTTVVNRLPATKSMYEHLRQDFVKEATILQQIHHKKIVEYVAHFDGNGTTYIVTEYYEGVTLNNYLKNISLKERKKLFENIFIPLIDAIQYIHKQGIIHRDIKPSNILIDTNDGVHLIDFGAAAFYKNQKEFVIYTTTGFSPLEQYSKQSVQDVRTDIYSFVATLYYSLTNQVPENVTQRLVRDKMKSAQFYNNHISTLLAVIIKWGLTVKRTRRCFSITFIKLALIVEKWLK